MKKSPREISCLFVKTAKSLTPANNPCTDGPIETCFQAKSLNWPQALNRPLQMSWERKMEFLRVMYFVSAIPLERASVWCLMFSGEWNLGSCTPHAKTDQYTCDHERRYVDRCTYAGPLSLSLIPVGNALSRNSKHTGDYGDGVRPKQLLDSFVKIVGHIHCTFWSLWPGKISWECIVWEKRRVHLIHAALWSVMFRLAEQIHSLVCSSQYQVAKSSPFVIHEETLPRQTVDASCAEKTSL